MNKIIKKIIGIQTVRIENKLYKNINTVNLYVNRNKDKRITKHIKIYNGLGVELEIKT